MPELLLHYIWLKGLANAYEQVSTDGRRIEILYPGKHNLDAGPDFSLARIRIYDEDGVGYMDYVGNVEIHLESSDWYRHHHEKDAAYDSIILHVVRTADKDIYNSKGEPIRQLVLRYPSELDYVQSYLSEARTMDSAFHTHSCSGRLLADPTLLTQQWKRIMLLRHLKCRKESIDRLLNATRNDWRKAFYISLAHYFGFHTNGIPFESLAHQTPLPVLLKHRNSLFQLTAILLGQSGLMSAETVQSEDERKLWNEYLFLRQKFSLEPINPILWKKGRMRPANSPVVRIRQFADLIYRNESLLTYLMETTDIQAMRAPFQAVGIGRDAADVLLINVVVPFLYAQQKKEAALHLLESLPSENNRIIRQWRTLGQEVRTAADSQALIHLYLTCCENHACMDCSVYNPTLPFPEYQD